MKNTDKLHSLAARFIKYSPLSTALSIICFLYLVCFRVSHDTCFLGFLSYENYDGAALLCVELENWTRCAMFLLSLLCLGPYVLRHVLKLCTRAETSWTRLGLTAGIVILFTACVALPQGMQAEMNGLSSGSSLSPAQARMIYTSFQSIFYPLAFAVLFQALADFQACSKRIKPLYIAAMLTAALGILLFDPRMYENVSPAPIDGIYPTLALTGLSLVLDCAAAMLDRNRSVENLPEGELCPLLPHGILLSVMALIITALFAWSLLDENRRWGDIDYTSLLEFVFVSALIVGLFYALRPVILYKHKCPRSLELLPLYFLMRLSFIMDYHYDELAPAPYPYAWNSWEPLLPELWAAPAVACLIYLMFLLYDYGMKEKPVVFLLFTAGIIALTYIPNDVFSGGIKLTTIAAANILMGISAPMLILIFARGQRECAERQKYIWADIEDPRERLRKFGYIYWLLALTAAFALDILPIAKELGISYYSFGFLILAGLTFPLLAVAALLLFGLTLSNMESGKESKTPVIRAVILSLMSFCSLIILLITSLAAEESGITIFSGAGVCLFYILSFVLCPAAAWSFCVGGFRGIKIRLKTVLLCFLNSLISAGLLLSAIMVADACDALFAELFISIAFAVTLIAPYAFGIYDSMLNSCRGQG